MTLLFFLGGGRFNLLKRQNRDAFSTLRRETFRASTRERTNERKKELSRALSRRGRSSSSSSSFNARSSFLLRCRSKKTPKGHGDPVFSALFFLCRKTKERKNYMEKEEDEKTLFVSFTVSLQFSFHFFSRQQQQQQQQQQLS